MINIKNTVFLLFIACINSPELVIITPIGQELVRQAITDETAGFLRAGFTQQARINIKELVAQETVPRLEPLTQDKGASYWLENYLEEAFKIDTVSYKLRMISMPNLYIFKSSNMTKLLKNYGPWAPGKGYYCISVEMHIDMWEGMDSATVRKSCHYEIGLYLKRHNNTDLTKEEWAQLNQLILENRPVNDVIELDTNFLITHAECRLSDFYSLRDYSKGFAGDSCLPRIEVPQGYRLNRANIHELLGIINKELRNFTRILIRSFPQELGDQVLDPILEPKAHFMEFIYLSDGLLSDRQKLRFSELCKLSYQASKFAIQQGFDPINAFDIIKDGNNFNIRSKRPDELRLGLVLINEEFGYFYIEVNSAEFAPMIIHNIDYAADIDPIIGNRNGISEAGHIAGALGLLEPDASKLNRIFGKKFFSIQGLDGLLHYLYDRYEHSLSTPGSFWRIKNRCYIVPKYRILLHTSSISKDFSIGNLFGSHDKLESSLNQIQNRPELRITFYE